MFIINIISSAATHVLRLIITAGVALDSVIFPHHRCSYSMVSDCSSTYGRLPEARNPTQLKRCPYGQEWLSRSELSWICNPAPLNIRICNPKYTVLTFFPHHRCSYSMVSDCSSTYGRLPEARNPTQLTQLQISAFSAIWFHRLSSRSAIQTSLIALA